MTRFPRILSLTLVVVSLPFAASSQVATGLPPFGSFGGGPFDTVNNANLNVHMQVPVFSRTGRGTNFSYSLGYDSAVWSPAGGVWSPAANWGWAGITQVQTGYITYVTGGGSCTEYPNPTYTWTVWGNFVYYDSFGAAHPFPNVQLTNWTSGTGHCGGPINNVPSGSTIDGSGYQINLGSSGPPSLTSLLARSGKSINAPLNQSTDINGSVIDTNGNLLSAVYNSGSGSTSFFDTLSGSTAALTLTGSGSAASPYTYAYPNPAGGTSNVVVNFTNYSVKTNFGCSGITEYTSPSSVPLTSSIVYPDGTSYSFIYETTPGNPGYTTGRLASVTLPTGGTISYAYSGGSNGITCADGSTATLTRTTPDGTWAYVHSESGSAWTTAQTDPQGNVTNLSFQGIYEVERQVYQGSSGTGTLLVTLNTCYNGSASPCTGTPVGLPISEVAATTILPGASNLESETATMYNSYGLGTETDEYDFGSGAVGTLTRKTITTYNTTLTNGIYDHPAMVQVETGAGTVVSQTNYHYDQTGVTATSGTPQHGSVSGSRGNLTTLQRLTAGSTYLSQELSYYDTGTINQATDTNNAVTTYSYGSSSCGNSFVTSVSLPLTLSASQVWNCGGAVQTSATDANSQTTSWAYTDSNFWRPLSATDPTGAATSISYAISPTATESTLNFNGPTSTIDTRTTLDGLGRTLVTQTLQSPGASSYDSTETDYDALGRTYRVTVPFTGTAGQTNSSAPATTTTYDSLSRPLTVTDGGGGVTNYSYSQNDVLVTVSPAPGGENVKSRQLEYDGLGRLSSVCEVTSVSGSGSCSQKTAATGFLTKYTYDVNNNILSVTQNAQASLSLQQGRSYAFDGLSRLTSETNAESGTTSYTYDTDSTCGTSAGDRVKIIDAVGNVTCYAYDALHRNTSITYPSGSYASVTPAKYFVYDAATVNGVAMANAKGRLAEAYTGSSKTTDLGFSYSARGEITDTYQSSPHSTTYYHVAATYWPSGLLNTLNTNLCNVPVWKYTPDGEGRVYSVGASSGQAPVSATLYNGFSQPLSITYGSTTPGTGDSDNLSYDPNTGRMIQFLAAINGSQTQTGMLSWNANGTLAELAISDTSNSANNQTCAYTHDDLTRLAKVDCGSGNWGQSFSFDAFGNIAKANLSGRTGINFLPTYAAATNRYQTLPSGTPAYDSNGNVTNDSFHTYAWDSDANVTTLDSGTTLTYDALDRRVEQANSGVYTQTLYGPNGTKLALVNGATVSKVFTPLPGGATAVYTSSGLAYYRHPDWLGSSRLASTPSRTVYYDGAYAPYGENYAESGTTDRNFTGQNQDTASDLYDFLYREYHPTQGRWVKPDPAGLAAVTTESAKLEQVWICAQ